MLKKIATDWSFWCLIIFNLYLLAHYQNHPDEFGMVVFLYWSQSVLIGLLNFFDLLTIRNILPGSMSVNDRPMTNNLGSRGCIALFFLVHYSIFHIGYLIFIVVKITRGFDYNFFITGLGILSVNLMIDFVRKKIAQQHTQVNVGKLFFLPYARIIPMHLMILLPEFLKVSNITVFIVLKIVMDIVMHFAISGKVNTVANAE